MISILLAISFRKKLSCIQSSGCLDAHSLADVFMDYQTASKYMWHRMKVLMLNCNYIMIISMSRQFKMDFKGFLSQSNIRDTFWPSNRKTVITFSWFDAHWQFLCLEDLRSWQTQWYWWFFLQIFLKNWTQIALFGPIMGELVIYSFHVNMTRERYLNWRDW